MMHNANRELVKQAFDVLYTGYTIDEVDVSQIRGEQRGRCVWFIVLHKDDGTDINTAEGIDLAKKLRRNKPHGAKFIACGRHGVKNKAAVAKYVPEDCRCKADFDSNLTQFPIKGDLLRSCSEAVFDVTAIIEVFDSMKANKNDDVMVRQFLDDIVNFNENNNQKVTFITVKEEEDEDDDVYNIEVMYIEPMQIMNTIKTKIN